MRYWLELTFRFLSGQSVNRVLNLIVGIVILRFLTIDQFALYTIASVLMVTVSLGSDLGLSQASVSIGARFREHPNRLASLYYTTLHYKKILFAGSALVTMLSGSLFFSDHSWSPSQIASILILVLLGGWIQLPNEVSRSILQIKQDSGGLFRVGLAEAITRLLLLAFIFWYPTAIAAVAINVAGYLVSRYMLAMECKKLLPFEHQLFNDSYANGIKTIVLPMAPLVVYYSIQDQIGLLILGFLGQTNSIAEVGAMGRLSMIVGILALLSGFLIQPIFARIDDRKLFIKGVAVVIGVVSTVSVCVMSSVYLAPQAWLFIVGENYSSLYAELEMSMIAVLLSLAGGCISVIVISRGRTKGSSWIVVLGILSQALYAIFFVVDSSLAALTMNTLPRLVYLLVQFMLLARLLVIWDEGSPGSHINHL